MVESGCESEKNIRPSLVTLILLFLFLILSTYILLRANTGHNEPIVFWVIWIFYVIILSYVAFNFKIKHYMFGMVLFQLLIGIIWIFGQANPLPIGSDAIFESQYANTIITTGSWDIHAGLGLSRDYYGYSPLIHMTMAFMSMMTGADIYAIGKYFPLLERLFYFFVLFFVLRKLTSDKIAVIATLFIFSSPSMILIHTSRRLLAEPFLILTLLCASYQFTKIDPQQSRKYLALLPFFFVSVIIGHHMTFYFLIFILFSILSVKIIRHLRKKDKQIVMNDKAKIRALTFMIFSIAGVVVLAVSGILERDIGRLLGGIDALLSVNASGAGSAISAVGSTYSYPKVYVLMSMLFIVLFYLVFLFSFIKYIKKQNNDFLLGWSLASAFLLFVPAIAILTGTRVGKLFGTVGWGVGAIGMSILAAKYIWGWWQSGDKHKRAILGLLVVCLYCGGLLIAYPIQYYCSEDSEAAINEEIVVTGNWLEGQTEATEVLGGDRVAYDVITGVNMRFVRYDTNGLFFAANTEDLNNNLTQYYDDYSVRLFVVNDIVTIYQTVGNAIVPEENLERFNDVDVLNKIYSNNKVKVYMFIDD